MATQNSGNPWSAFLSQIPGNWTDGFTAIASASQAMADRWVKNRAAQVERDMAVWTKLTSCKDSREVAEIQKRWWQDTIDGLTAEAKEYQEQVTRLTQQSRSATQDGKPAPRPKTPIKTV